MITLHGRIPPDSLARAKLRLVQRKTQVETVVQQKQLNVDTKFYESGRVNSNLPPILFQSASKRFTRIYMGRKTERN